LALADWSPKIQDMSAVMSSVERAIAAKESPVASELHGVRLRVPNLSEYLVSLAYKLQLDVPEMAYLVGELPAGVSLSLETQGNAGYLVGVFPRHWIHYYLYMNWQDVPECEVEVVCQYLRQHSDLFTGCRSVYLGNANQCGSLRALREFGFSKITCADIAWPALYLGRAMAFGDLYRLPAFVLEDQLEFELAPDHRGFQRHAEPVRFREAGSWEGIDLSFEVANVWYAGSRPEDVLFYDGPKRFDKEFGVRSRLIHILHSLQRNQAMVFWAWLDDDLGAPDRVAELVQTMGCRVVFADLTQFPWNRRNNVRGYSNSLFKSFVLRVERVQNSDPRAIRIQPTKVLRSFREQVESGAPLEYHGRPIPLYQKDRDLLQRVIGKGCLSFEEWLSALQPVPDQPDWTLGLLIQKQLLELDLNHR
jgi:hypothetical protein